MDVKDRDDGVNSSPKSSEQPPPAKKLKQTRLPFAPIPREPNLKDKVEVKAPEKLPEGKVDVVGPPALDTKALSDGDVIALEVKEDRSSCQPGKKRRRRRSSSSKQADGRRLSAAAAVVVVADDEVEVIKDVDKDAERKRGSKEGQGGRTPVDTVASRVVAREQSVCSPKVMEERTRRLRVAIAKLAVKLNELKDSMEKAVERQEFLEAQGVKEEMSKVMADKAELEQVLKRSDPEEMKGVLSSPSSTPISLRTLAAAATEVASPSPLVKTPVSGALIKTPVSGALIKTPASGPVVKTPGTCPMEGSTEGSAKPSSSPSPAGSSSSSKKKPLTPKQAEQSKEKARLKEEARKAKELEAEKAKLERERLKREKEIEKREKDLERERSKREKEAKKELVRSEKEAEKERLRLEKEAEKERLKSEKDRVRSEKEAEKKRQEEVLQVRQAKLAASFASFFVKNDSANLSKDPVAYEASQHGGHQGPEEEDQGELPLDGPSKGMASKALVSVAAAASGGPPASSTGGQSSSGSACRQFNPFRVKKDMKLAPLSRRGVAVPHGGGLGTCPPFGKDAKAALDTFLSSKNASSTSKKACLYLEELRSKGRSPMRTARTWPLDTAREDENGGQDDEVQIVELEDEEDDEAELEVSSYGQQVDIGCDDMDEGGEIKSTDLKGSNRGGKEGPPSTASCRKTMRAKLLQFCENERPPYWGTWSKKSGRVGPRRPFAKDCHFFDYDYDSDDDWEEEEQGESLSDEEKDKEEEEDAAQGDDDDEEDDGFFVGHGVLGKDEAHLLDSDVEEDLADEDLDEDLDDDEDDEDEGDVESNEDEPDLRDKNKAGGKKSKSRGSKGRRGSSSAKAADIEDEVEMKKMSMRAQQFEEEYSRKKAPGKLKPRVFGCFWCHTAISEEDGVPPGGVEEVRRQNIVYEQLLKILDPFRAVIVATGSASDAADGPGWPSIETSLSARDPEDKGAAGGLLSPSGCGDKASGASLKSSSGGATPNRRVGSVFPDKALPDLVRLVHLNPHKKVFLANEFKAFWKNRCESSSKAPSPVGGAVDQEPVVAELSKAKVIAKIQEIADYIRGTKQSWVVKPEVLERLSAAGSGDCAKEWEYLLEQPTMIGRTPKASSSTSAGGDGKDEAEMVTPKGPKRRSLLSDAAKTPLSASTSTAVSLITRFTRVLTPEERQKQLEDLKAPKPQVPPSGSKGIAEEKPDGAHEKGVFAMIDLTGEESK